MITLPATPATEDYFDSPICVLNCAHCGAEIHGKIRRGTFGWIHANPADRATGGWHAAAPAAD